MGSLLDAYIECALWSSTDNADDGGGEPLDANYSPSDLAPEALAKMQADCAAFEAKASDLISTSECRRGNGEWTKWEQAGHDFWLTRNGHGAGFWDGDWPEPAGEALTKLAESFVECDLYVGDDGWLYLS